MIPTLVAPWLLSSSASAYDNEHTVTLYFPPGSTPTASARRTRGQWLLVAPLTVVGLLLRRRQP